MCTYTVINQFVKLRQGSHYSTFSFRRTVIAPPPPSHDADVLTTSCSVIPSAIPSFTILKSEGIAGLVTFETCSQIYNRLRLNEENKIV